MMCRTQPAPATGRRELTGCRIRVISAWRCASGSTLRRRASTGSPFTPTATGPPTPGPLFYVGTDYNAEHESWRGLVVGANRGYAAGDTVDLGDFGYADPYTGWVVVTVDFNYTGDTFTLAVDGVPRISKSLSAFKGTPDAATRPDTLYIGSLARLQKATRWTDIELDWGFGSTPPSPRRRQPTVCWRQPSNPRPRPPVPTPPIPRPCPPAPSATPLTGAKISTSRAQAAQCPTTGSRSPIPIRATPGPRLQTARPPSEITATPLGCRFGAIFDDMLPVDILSTSVGERDTPAAYLQQRGGSPFWPGGGRTGRNL